ncbi:MAG: glycoside hydrolase/phage tail family protein [Pseudomonadota bacterium]
MLRGVDLIPAATEFGYSPSVIEEVRSLQTIGGDGTGLFARVFTTGQGPVNAIRNSKTSDWSAALDMLQGVLPSCDTVALVVSWFGTDLRCAHCEVQPRVEFREKQTSRPWVSGGQTRETANLVSYVDGKPAFGSSPDDQSVMDAIADLRARGFRIVLYPFIMMDIPQDNDLPDREGSTGQPAYPWRGRMGLAVDDGSALQQVSDFVGAAQPADFSASGVPAYAGSDGWTYRRFILHLAALARNAGGVDAFLVGTEMVDMSMATDTPGAYPFVDALVDLAADVKTMLPNAAVSYAADWSEYHSHRTPSDVYFHLDPLWSSSDVDFIGIDNYLPVSDWRPGTSHADYDPARGHTSPYALDYLKSNIEGGEYWDWYYETPADRVAQRRSPITDGAHGEPWVYRQKAIRDWWGNAHHNRNRGSRSPSPTGWVPESKPVWFTEFGCPAIDLAGNQPNVFYDPKSTESFFPHHSSGVRDDFAQRQYLRAMLEWWRDNGGDCVDVSNMFAWSWDARPWPEFPRAESIWSDGINWRRGHWLNGRAGNAPAREVLERRLITHYGYDPDRMDLSACFGQADGTLLPGPVSFREALATWETGFHLDTSEFEAVLRVASRAAAQPVVDLTLDDLVENGTAPLYTVTRKSLEETPRVAVVQYSDTDRDYERGAARAVIRDIPGGAEATADLALVSDLDRMTGVAEMLLRVRAGEREDISLTLPPSSNLAPGDVFTLTPRDGAPLRFIASEVTRGAARSVRGTLYNGASFAAVGGPARPGLAVVSPASTIATPILMDLPTLPGVEAEDHQGFAAFLSAPWPGGVDLYRSTSQATGYGLNTRAGLEATIGATASNLVPAPCALWSAASVEVALVSGAFVSRSEADVFDGANALAVQHTSGAWEVLQFRDAELIGTDRWRLSGLLRGQLGTDSTIGVDPLPAGARLVALDAAALPVTMTLADIGRELWWKAVPIGRDPVDAQAVAHAFTGAGLRPYAPGHLTGSEASGALSLSWVRRSRIDGSDFWADPPLGEGVHRFRVEIGPEAAPLVSVDVDGAETVTGLDVSGVSGPQEVRIAQVSEIYGPGPAARLTLTF